MQLENTFTVPVGIDKAWAAFNDPKQVAPCFPGATLESYEDDSFTGTVKVKLGPISLTYKGKGTFVERDDKAHRVVIDASGRDSRGNGTASAKVTGTMVADGDSKTTVTMVTDMTVTGRPAQFGRGVMVDVSDKIVGQFSSCLAKRLGDEPVSESATSSSSESGTASSSTSGSSASSAPASSEAPAPASSGLKTAAAPAAAEPASANGVAPKLASAPEPTRSEVDAIDLLDTAGAPVLKRAAPAVLALLVLFILLRRIRNARRA